MDHIKIEGIHVYNGVHPLDVTYFTNRELHIIKKVAGVRANELNDAFQAGDTDLIVALAVIALRRGGHQVEEDLIWDAPLGSVTFVSEEETEQDPPEHPPSGSVGGENENAKKLSSGGSSPQDGDHPANPPRPTGTLGSATGAPSVPAT